MGPWDRFVIMLVPIVFIVSVSGVVLLLPLFKRLGDLLELMVEDRGVSSSAEVEDVVRRLESIEGRIARIEGSRAVERASGSEGVSAVGAGDSD